MRVPLSWLKEYVEITQSPEELAHTLTMAGLEVEAIEYIGQTWGDKIITAQIDHLEKVEGSDHLNYTKINTGSSQINVICGAPNIRLGDKVPLALPGAQVGDITISETRKFGYVSQGMLCSPRELGMGNDHSGIYILDADTPLGQPLVDLLGEVVLDFSIKAHRGDVNSIIGIAREVAALTKRPLRLPEPRFQEQGTAATEMVRVTVEDSELCPRYTARVVSNVKVGPSPSWMARRLLAAGLRPISNVVDITNYVLLEYGQPLHSFDYDLVPEHHIIVRHARPGEELTTLDDIKRKLTPDMLLITDPTGPTAIAGVMGGAASEVSDKTTNVLLESANFHPGNVRRTSTTLGLRTDASSHFEKGLDPELTLLGANRAMQLLAELAGGSVHPGVVDIYPHPVQPRTMPFSTDEVEWLTSMQVTQDEVVEALGALDFSVTPDEDGKSMQVTVPTYRTDVTQSADLVEEVIRLIGYEHIPSTIPDGPLPEQTIDRWFEREQVIRNLMIGAGLNEIVTYTLTSRTRMIKLLAQADAASASLLLQAPNRSAAQEEARIAASNINTSVAPFDARALPALTVVNPLSPELESLRLTLMSNLMETIQQNSKHNKDGLRFFEVGRRYLPTDGTSSLPDERRTLGFALSGPAENTWLPELSRPADFYDLKGVAETLLAGLKIRHYRFVPTQHPTFHPGRCALLELAYTMDNGDEVFRPVGVLGEVHPLVQQRYDLAQRAHLAEFDLEALYAAVPTQLTYQPISRHQALTRDLALVVDQHIAAQDIKADIIRHGGELLRSADLFDVYTGDPIPAGKKNLTYTLVYQAQDRTLKDSEANELQERIIRMLHEDFGAVLR
ncbi:phenylalanine--tRNA ligase subunit beta [Dictyobacter aurantiacus]|uniref:Phenylalanine--tRNA ligase beta subunit n=1 Tax=Dictyobacter aurantiacus TaxID=1936993 RepID=A0A401ZBG0_9CHLR|nr:phenylalanine--tRNA ligase subunit beta [Dictyobacter aurantiacus]GCE04220.1 phenylalanine--tRNA ligase beta subunit [Dictyobacter aurantiacus]